MKLLPRPVLTAPVYCRNGHVASLCSVIVCWLKEKFARKITFSYIEMTYTTVGVNLVVMVRYAARFVVLKHPVTHSAYLFKLPMLALPFHIVSAPLSSKYADVPSKSFSLTLRTNSNDF